MARPMTQTPLVSGKWAHDLVLAMLRKGLAKPVPVVANDDMRCWREWVVMMNR